MQRNTPGALILAAAMTAGCGPNVEFSDSVSLTLNFSEFVPFQSGGGDFLTTPYVQGATMRVYARDKRREERIRDWTLQSSDSSILEVGQTTWHEDREILIVDAVAIGPGEAEVLLVDDDGEPFESVPVDVAFPDRVELHPAGPMFVDLDYVEETPQVLDGGTATFQVRYFDGDTRLYGHGGLGVDLGTHVAAQPLTTFLFEDREWLQVTPHSPVEEEVEAEVDVGLSVDGTHVTTVDLVLVEEEDVADVVIYGRDESEAEEEQWLVLYAQAYDGGGVPIYGVEYTWEVEGNTKSGEGDLYRYAYDPEVTHDVSATFGEVSAQTTASTGEGYVDSSNRVGCATGGALPLGWLLLAVPAFLAGRDRLRR